MSKLRCGVVILSIGLVGVANAAIDIGGLPKRTDTSSYGSTHADAGKVDTNFARVDGNINTVATQVNANETAINGMKEDVATAKKNAADAITAAAESAKSAAASAETVSKFQGDISALQTDVSKVQTTVSGLVDSVASAVTDGQSAVKTASEAKDTAAKAVTEVTDYKNAIDIKVADYQANVDTRVNNIDTKVTEVKASIQGAIQNSSDALIQSGDAKRIAEAANTTSQRVEAGLAQEVIDRKADVERGVAESKAYADTRFKEFDNKIGEVKKFAAAGTAAALAASQIPQVSQGSAFSLGVGLGSYSGESALSLGISARLGDYTVTKLSVTSDTSNNIGMGGGIAVEW